MNTKKSAVLLGLLTFPAACGAEAEADHAPAAAPSTEAASSEPGSAEVSEEGEKVDEAEQGITWFKIIRCPSHERGMPCMDRCAKEGISCASGLRHPKKPDAGNGELFECRAALVAKSCWYYYPSIQEKCVFFNYMPPWCEYQGGQP